MPTAELCANTGPEIERLKRLVWAAKNAGLLDISRRPISIAKIAFEARYTKSHANMFLNGAVPCREVTRFQFIELMAHAFLRLLPKTRKTKTVRDGLNDLLAHTLRPLPQSSQGD